MSCFKVGYFVGSLATASINRLLAKALVRLAPPEHQLSEIPFKDLPLYSYDYDTNFPPVATSFKSCTAMFFSASGFGSAGVRASVTIAMIFFRIAFSSPKISMVLP